MVVKVERGLFPPCEECKHYSLPSFEEPCSSCIAEFLENTTRPGFERDETVGKWVDSEPEIPDYSYKKNGMAYYCSRCGHRAGKNKHKTYRYCPWCGARMVNND